MTSPSPQEIDPRVAAFVGRNVEYYDRVWTSFGDPDSPNIKFNIAAIFFSAGWLLYRKLYLHFAVFIGVIAVDVSLTIYLEDNGLVSPKVIAAWDNISPFIYAAVVGGLSNNWYYNKFLQVGKQAESESPDPGVQQEFLQQQGGVNYIGPVVLLVAMILFFVWATQPVS